MKPTKKPKEKQKRVVDRAKAAANAPAAGAAAKPLSVICDRCSQETGPLHRVRRTLKKGLLAVGLICPHCGFWVHSYYSSPELERAIWILGNFKAQRTRSKEDHHRYEQKLAQFQGKEQKVQRQVKKLLRSIRGQVNG